VTLRAACVIALALMAIGAPAVADPNAGKTLVGILEVRVEGGSKEMQAKFEQQLEQQLDSKQYWLANRAAMRDRLKFSTRWTEGCVIGDCIAEVRTQTQAQLVLLAALSGSGTSFGYVVTLVRTDTGRVLAQKSERCDVCTIDEAMTEATLATIQLLNDIPPKLPEENAVIEAAAARAKVSAVEGQMRAGHRHTNHIGTAIAIAGLAVAAGGVGAYLGLDHPAWGLGVAGAGAGLALAGVVVLTF
jgi:hypothetical protein